MSSLHTTNTVSMHFLCYNWSMCHPVTLLLGIHNAVNPLLHIGHYSVRMAKISILKVGIIKKIQWAPRLWVGRR